MPIADPETTDAVDAPPSAAVAAPVRPMPASTSSTSAALSGWYFGAAGSIEGAIVTVR
ncbi:hypothetical protein [Plantactinospora soyae]|uniref:Uncharacterized protein n=1 Tax=Plantactinospora soyae TaxID=1544732 RepID=A0A927MAP1_9ACTN|nr:hypothetical protein [Plantactinospora soyae]MBE1489666.1 hypothetical protein [Plantactinospora soyae]